MTGLITEIERCSTHDGPGLRTVVFLKGCPLSCAWCHNPECISPRPEELYYRDKCLSCGHCDEGCVTGARVLCGREMTVGEVLTEILADRDYYGKDGGVTVSGGEPLLRRDFTAELLRECRLRGIGTAIETSMYRYDEEIFSLCDVIMCDIKTMDDDTHKRFTGIGNRTILDTVRRADSLGIPMIVRTPVIPSVNATEENIRATRDFLRGLKNIIRYELLPYHPLGLTKATALGREMTVFDTPTKEQMEELSRYADLR